MAGRMKRLFTRDDLEYEFLPPALEIQETPPSPVKRVLIWVIFAIVLVTFAWSYFGMVEIVAEARGKVVPDGRVKVIQPMEEGVIKAILVEEGQRVRKGQLLIELDHTIKQADMESNVKALHMHRLDKERLVKELEGKNSGEKPSEGGAGNHQNVSADLHEVQDRLRSARESEYRAREEAQRLVIAQRESALQAAEAILVKLEKTFSIVSEQESSLRSLHQGGFAARMEWRDKEKELYSVQQELEAQKKQVQQARDGLDEARKALESVKHERDKSILTDIVEREKNINAIEGEVVKARKRYDMERLVSPVEGTVHGLAMRTIGGIVKPAQDMVSVVPLGTPLIIEAMVLNKDVGFVKVGQETEAKLDAFSFQKYGTIRGKVLHISPDAVEDEKLGPVYKMKASLEKTTMLVDGKEVPIAPGMSASVEVKTGKRRVIEFFLSPIIKYARESLTVR
jgi:hemolysin D